MKSYFDYIEDQKGMMLSDEQKQAVSHGTGPGLVLATAGSGKTTVITTRIGKLIYEGDLDGGRILTITFSKLAAKEMTQRFQELFPEMEADLAHFSTIHSFAYRIVKEYFKNKRKKLGLLKNNYDVLKKIMIKIYSRNGSYAVGTDEVENASNQIGYVKNMGIEETDESGSKIEVKDFWKIFREYEQYKRKNDLIDFDDMLIYCNKILKHHPNLSRKFKKYYQYIQLDEAQDTSKIQYEIIQQLSNGNLFMVGDDDQSIYSFRGSYPEMMLQLKERDSSAKIYPLNHNYRCDGHIVESAKKLINQNGNRYKKDILPKQSKKQPVVVQSFLTRRQQADYVVDAIQSSLDKKTAVLYRYNISSLIPAEKLRQAGIAFFAKEDGSKFFNSSVYKDIESFFELAIDPYNKKAFENIYYKCQTYFTKEMMQYVINSPMNVYDGLKTYPNSDGLKQKNGRIFKSDMKQINQMKPETALDYIRYEMGYEAYLQRMERDGRMTFSNLLLNLEIIKEVCRNVNTIQEYLVEVASLKQLLIESRKTKSANVVLSSIHSTKGLEFDQVFLLDNIHGEFPMAPKNRIDADYNRYLEEERRVFYVGMTRAKQRLELLYPETPSEFITLINKGLSKQAISRYNIGMKVRHKVLGDGEIVDVDKNTLKMKNAVNKIYTLDLEIVQNNDLIRKIENGGRK